MADKPARPTSDYPVNLNLENRRCLVIGGGKVAERKIAALLQAGADVTVISPRLTENLTECFAAGQFCYRAEGFSQTDLQGYLLVLKLLIQCTHSLNLYLLLKLNQVNVLLLEVT